MSDRMDPLKRSRSEELTDVLERPPRWIIRWGVTSMISIGMLFLFASYLYKYPDVILANVVLTTANPPISLLAKVDGQIDDLYVSNGGQVRKGDVIAIIKNSANLDDITDLKADLGNLKSIFATSKSQRDAFGMGDLSGTQYSVGEVQEYYSDLVRRYSEIRNLSLMKYYDKKIEGKKQELAMSRTYYSKLSRQLSTLEKELVIAYDQFRRDSLLHVDSVFSALDYENSARNYLQKVYTVEGAEVNLASVQINIAKMEQELVEMKMEGQRHLKELLHGLYQSYNVLTSKIQDWEEKYLIRTPLDGTVSFSKFWTTNQNVQTGEVVVSIVPNVPSFYLAKATTSMRGSGKLTPGLKVNIKLDGYPYLEYGFLRARISYISKVSEGEAYYLDLALEDTLRTSQNIVLRPSQRMTGSAEIITADKRLISRIFEPILAILDEGLSK